jgi:serine/threonine protein kinase
MDLIGCGHFAAVYTVHDLRYETEVFCVKIIALKSSEEDVTLTFHAELDTLMSLTHPNIITVYAHFASANYLYLILEYCEKGSLENIIGPGKNLPADVVRDYCRQMATAMAYLHSRNFCHRDIKPANILIDKYGRLKLADFGFARPYTEQDSTICGSVPYMSPELVQRRLSDPKANDIWALGVTFYEVAFGYLPWTSKRANGMSAEIAAGAVQIPVDASPNFSVLLRKMLALDPVKRGTMQELLQMPFLAGRVVHAQQNAGGVPTLRPTSGQGARGSLFGRSSGYPGKHHTRIVRVCAVSVPEDDEDQL